MAMCKVYSHSQKKVRNT